VYKNRTSQVIDFQYSFLTKNFERSESKFQALGIQISSPWNFIFERLEFLRERLPEKWNNPQESKKEQKEKLNHSPPRLCFQVSLK